MGTLKQPNQNEIKIFIFRTKMGKILLILRFYVIFEKSYLQIYVEEKLEILYIKYKLTGKLPEEKMGLWVLDNLRYNRPKSASDKILHFFIS